jgi:hypothetical protein
MIPGKYSQEINTFFVIEMLKLGFLGFRQFKPSFAHSLNDVDLYAEAVDEVFSIIAKTPAQQLLTTPTAHLGFHRLTKE